jgi:OOP family OmpA-OmpF porin
MIQTRRLLMISIVVFLCALMPAYGQIEDVPASKEMIDEPLHEAPAKKAQPPQTPADTRSSATIILDPATMLYQDLIANGHAVLTGISFHDDNTLTIESDSCLAIISAMLTNHADMNIYIVGHTDNTAGVLAGMIISQKHAEAVMNTLSSRFGIDLDRLFASGVGPLSPITTNETEQGRAINSRVELVIQ